jgi:hypothetical protein
MPFTVRVYDAVGRTVVRRVSAHGGTEVMDLFSHIPQGLYVVQAVFDETTINRPIHLMR